MISTHAFGGLRTALLAAAVALCTTGCAQELLECGPETEEISGYCTVLPEPSPNCGEGTDLDASSNECVTRIDCGPGTELDPGTGECAPLSECGAGTVIDLATGECVATVQCGAGTILDNGECVTEATCGPGTVLAVLSQTCMPLNPCFTGTEYNPLTGKCEADLSCAQNQVEVDGVCLPEGRGLAGYAQAWEALADTNDPAYGGRPETLPALMPTGEPLVFLGTIGRPADFDGNGSIEQDRDVWQFDGTGGQYLRVRVLSAGLPQPVFLLDGPGGYHRESAIGYVREADRKVLLPRSGVYRLTVVPSIHETAGVAIGGTEANYVGAIEEIPLPTLPFVAPAPPGDAPAEVVGNLTGLDDNFVQLQAPARTAVIVRFTSLEADARPAVIAVGDDGRLVTELVIDQQQGAWAATFVDAPNSTRVLIDWVSSRGRADGFVADLRTVPLVEAGTLTGESAVASPAQDIDAGATGAFAYQLAGSRVLQLEITAQAPFVAPDLQLLGPDGTRAVEWDKDSLFAYAEGGDYVVFVNNDDTNDQVGVFIAGALPPTVDLGTLDPATNPTTSVSGVRLTQSFGGPESFWAIVATPPATVIELVVSAEAGEPEIAAYSRGGHQLRRVARPQLHRRIHVPNDGGDTIVIDLHPFTDQSGKFGAVENWTLDVTALPRPVSIDGEPNNTLLTSTPLGDLPIIGTGTLTETTAAFNFRDKDDYTFTLPSALPAGQGVAIWFDNIDADPALFDNGGVSLRVYGADRLPVASIPGQIGLVSGVLAPSTVTYLTGEEGAGQFYIELTEWRVEQTAGYVLRAEVIDFAFEAEPNDTRPEATPLGGMPARMVGYWDSDSTAADYYSFDLSGDLPIGVSVVASLENLENTDPFTLQLQDGSGTPLITAQSPSPSLQAAALTAGTYYLRAAGSATQSPPYELRLSLSGATEVEPNDNTGQANVLGSLAPGSPLTIDGIAATGSTDVYRFTLAATLAADQSLFVQALNLTDRSNVRVDLYDGPDPASSAQLAYDSGPIATATGFVSSTGPFAIKVTGSGDRYRLVVDVGPQAESEPNETDTAATLISAPVVVSGIINRPDVDVFRVPINAVASNRALQVLVRNIADSSSISVELRGPTFGTVIAGDSGPTSLVSGIGLAAGNYWVRIAQPSGSSFETDYYELDVQIVDVQ